MQMEGQAEEDRNQEHNQNQEKEEFRHEGRHCRPYQARVKISNSRVIKTIPRL